MEQPSFFDDHLTAVVLDARYIEGQGWQLVVTARRGRDRWPDHERSKYGQLSRDELLDVFLSEIESRLGSG